MPAAARRRCCPTVNLFCYGQVESPYGSGEFINVTRTSSFAERREADHVAEIDEQGRRSTTRIKEFLGTGK